MKKDVKVRIYQDKFNVCFADIADYDKYIYTKRKYFVLLCILFLLSAAWIVLIVCGLFNNFNLVYVSFLVLFILAVFSVYMNKFIDYKNQYYFNLIIREIKRNNWKIKYSNNKTGHITFIKDNIGTSIYVFKGKNAKGAR